MVFSRGPQGRQGQQGHQRLQGPTRYPPQCKSSAHPLPEAQIDRFLFKLVVGYPSMDAERIVMRQNNSKLAQDLKSSTIVQPSQILEAQTAINDIYVDEKIEDYVLNLIFSTREPNKYGLKDLNGIIDFGASPRATINIIRAAKARAFIEHRGYITPEDVRYIGFDVLRHRVILTYEAEAEELTPDAVIQRLFDTIEVP